MSDDESYLSEVEESAPRDKDLVSDPEEWMDYNSEFLVALWHGLKDHAASMGVYVLDTCTIGDFTEFCYKFSSGRKPPC